MSFEITLQTITLPSGREVTFRPLLASEAREMGLGVSEKQQASGPQIRWLICRAARSPRFVDAEEASNGKVPIYALGAEDELALFTTIMEASFGGLAKKLQAPKDDPFPDGAGGGGEARPDGAGVDAADAAPAP